MLKKFFYVMLIITLVGWPFVLALNGGNALKPSYYSRQPYVDSGKVETTDQEDKTEEDSLSNDFLKGMIQYDQERYYRDLSENQNPVTQEQAPSPALSQNMLRVYKNSTPDVDQHQLRPRSFLGSLFGKNKGDEDKKLAEAQQAMENEKNFAAAIVQSILEKEDPKMLNTKLNAVQVHNSSKVTKQVHPEHKQMISPMLTGQNVKATKSKVTKSVNKIIHKRYDNRFDERFEPYDRYTNPSTFRKTRRQRKFPGMRKRMHMLDDDDDVQRNNDVEGGSFWRQP